MTAAGTLHRDPPASGSVGDGASVAARIGHAVAQIAQEQAERQAAEQAAQAAARIEGAALYEHDFHAWAERQTALLKARDFGRLDLENLIEEVDHLARQNRQQIRNRLVVLLVHLLKWHYQPEGRLGGSWRGSIVEQRNRIAALIEDSPSLVGHPTAVLARAYRDARSEAAAEMDRPVADLPAECPFTIGQALDAEFLPDLEVDAPATAMKKARPKRNIRLGKS